ncbi:MAG: response regulator transcription factor [Bacteroidaceae bacterium]|nr:response regulator transcription factor [Bacteroidaceae bacterium]
MSDLIHDDYRLLQVISRFGISLGFGEQTVAEACASSGVDAPTFLAVVNFIQSEDAVSDSELVSHVSVKALMHYLQQSHNYFVDFRLPAIRRKLIEAIDCSARDQVAFLILKYYDEYADEVRRHMEYENKHIHTYVQQLLDGVLPQGTSYSTLAHQHQDNHASIEKSSHELKSVIVKYYPPNGDTPRMADTLMDIYIMEEDLFSHCRLEDSLFARAVRRLETSVSSSHGGKKTSPTSEKPEDPKSVECLSEREREVVQHVVRGMSNKEIADRMFISVNTVMTHRRNISRKLQIHSPAALTIYAIVNRLINIDDVKL